MRAAANTQADHRVHPFCFCTTHTFQFLPVTLLPDALHCTESDSPLASSRSRKVSAMAERIRPPGVFTVDTYSSRPPPIPPRPVRRAPPPSGGAAQSLLFLLVALALCGMVIEAYCILQLYKNQPVSVWTLL